MAKGAPDMACKNHPDELTGLTDCSRCGDAFCPSCVVELGGAFLCAECKQEHVRDIQSGVDPSGLELATITKRLLALTLDGALWYATIGVLALVALPLILHFAPEEPFRDSASSTVLFIAAMVVAYGAPVVYEGMMLQKRGQTLGKMAMGIKVVTPEGNDISAGQAWLRVFMKLLLAMPYGLTFFAAIFSKQRRTLHDSIARTRVVRLP
jgi:uncharacterized RDD family membrane protein YckC